MSVLAFDIETVKGEWLPADYPVCEKWIREQWLAKPPHPDFPTWLTEQRQQGHAAHAVTGAPPALHPTTCRIVQMSFGWRSGGELHREIIQWDNYDPGSEDPHQGERHVVDDALEHIAGAVAKKTVLVGFNSKGFDLWCLRFRARLLGLPDPHHIPWGWLLHPYDDRAHVDLRLTLGNGNRFAKGTLQWWAEAFGVPAEEKGGDVQDMVDRGAWDELRRYGESEAATPLLLYEKAVA